MPDRAQALEAFLRAVSFRLIAPDHRRDAAQRLVIDRPGREPAMLLELYGAPFDALNTEMPDDLKRRLRPLLDVPRMSTLATAGVLNRAVASMPAGQAFVNVGVWQGFTFLAGMTGNPDAKCIGIDNFSEFYGPRDVLLARFEEHRGPGHRFFDMDYRDYFAGVHEGPIGVYLYDGEHSYENQMRGLEAAEPFFAEDCVLVVDDTNRPEPRRATLDFIAARAGEYGLIADIWTGANSHPTYWNGLLMIGRGWTGETLVVPGPDPEQAPPAPGPDGGRSPAVSLVVLDADGDSALRARVLDAARAQTWPHLEVLEADGVRDPAAALADALARSSGSLIAFIDTSVDLNPDTVELSVAYPGVIPFWRPVDDTRMQRGRQGLRAAAEVDDVIPPGSEYILIADVLGMPTTCAAGPGTPLQDPGPSLDELDDQAARAAVDRAHAAGARHMVVMSQRFRWLDQRPGLVAHLDQAADRVLANRRVRVFRFRARVPA